MTNKPMLSVERDLIERAVQAIINTSQMQPALNELRALLDKPSTERKPFAWYRVPKDFPLQGAFFPYIEGQSEHDIQNTLDAEFGFNVKRLYDEPPTQSQREKVAVMYEDGTILTKEECGDSFEICCKVETPLYAEQPAPCATIRVEKVGERLRASVARFCVEKLPVGSLVNVYAEQPAPVAVVMPEPYGLAMFKMASGFESVTAEQFDLVWTACRKEVARLNGLKP